MCIIKVRQNNETKEVFFNHIYKRNSHLYYLFINYFCIMKTIIRHNHNDVSMGLKSK